MAVLAVGLLGTHLGCGKAPEPVTAAQATLPDTAVEIAREPSIRGRVLLRGGRPQSAGAPVDVGNNPFCGGHGAIANPIWRLSDDGGLADVVVTVAGPAAALNIPDEPVLIDQKDCLFVPHVTVVQAGQWARIRNGDETFHNVRIALHEIGTRSGGQNQDNFGQPAKGFESRKHFEEAGVYRLECDVHRWMKSWVVAHENAHAAVTTDGGRFVIERELADGEYVVEAWHPQFAQKLTQTVRVENGEGQVEFAFQLPDAFDP